MKKFFLLTVFSFFIIACTQKEVDPNTIEVWFHSGRGPERKTIEDQVARFNESQDQYRVKLTMLPEGSYNEQVQAAALAGTLPDVLEFDGPFLYNYIWQGRLLPLDNLLSEKTKGDLLPSIVKQGTYHDRLYAVGTFDSGLCLYGNRSELEAAGIRIPKSPEKAWTAKEFDQILEQLFITNKNKPVLDLKLNYQGEWYTYAFSPLLQSAGGDLINRETYQSAKDVLNSPESIDAMKKIQSWFAKGYVDSNTDDASFIQKRVPLSWVGHWEYPRYSKALGDDLVLIPLPDFGQGSKTGQGSWAWSITKTCRNKEAAIEFIEFLLKPYEIIAMTNANGAVPATKSAIKKSKLYGRKGPLRLFVDQLNVSAVPRPITPAYPVITSVFQQAFQDIRNGADVKMVLDKASAEIDQDIADNKGYPEQIGNH